MKKITTLFLAATILASCGEPDKRAQLADLKKQLAEISAQIKTLETEIAAGGQTTTTESGKTVAVEVLKNQLFQHFVEVQGKIEAEENVAVSSEMPGVVTKVYVKVGDMVTKGQPLAELNNKAIAQQIVALNTQLDFVKTAFEKQKALWDKKIGTEIQYLQAKSQKEALESQLASLKAQGQMSVISSPISGVVDGVTAKVGQMSAPGYAAFTVVNLSSLKVKGEVPESYAPKVKAGSEVTLFFPDINKEVKAKVGYSAKVINELSRTFNVEVDLPAGNDYNPNMIALLKVVDYKSDSAIVVPTDVVQRAETSSFVLVSVKEKGKNIVKKRVVEVGSSYNGNTEILNGLQAGDVIITKGYQNVNEGDAIQF
ncbi:MAG: efflux RND transporter periplasmic adaptor subunit [Flavobacteriales bacterium]